MYEKIRIEAVEKWAGKKEWITRLLEYMDLPKEELKPILKKEKERADFFGTHYSTVLRHWKNIKLLDDKRLHIYISIDVGVFFCTNLKMYFLFFKIIHYIFIKKIGENNSKTFICFKEHFRVPWFRENSSRLYRFT